VNLALPETRSLVNAVRFIIQIIHIFSTFHWMPERFVMWTFFTLTFFLRKSKITPEISSLMVYSFFLRCVYFQLPRFFFFFFFIFNLIPPPSLLFTLIKKRCWSSCNLLLPRQWVVSNDTVLTFVTDRFLFCFIFKLI
jgi:hypothetical protein